MGTPNLAIQPFGLRRSSFSAVWVGHRVIVGILFNDSLAFIVVNSPRVPVVAGRGRRVVFRWFLSPVSCVDGVTRRMGVRAPPSGVLTHWHLPSRTPAAEVHADVSAVSLNFASVGMPDAVRWRMNSMG